VAHHLIEQVRARKATIAGLTPTIIAMTLLMMIPITRFAHKQQRPHAVMEPITGMKRVLIVALIVLMPATHVVMVYKMGTKSVLIAGVHVRCAQHPQSQ